ncbi:MAG: hypothetical protein M1840_002739 [Geoglossum simile]|nr:MAG: hypothetical protein M1840_002739 [Geoglossum simile]
MTHQTFTINICDASTIVDVPSQFVRAARILETGCHYAVKIANHKQLYFYTTKDGPSCYQATENIINTCGKSKKAGWINNGWDSFYQVGVRDINTIGPGDVTLEPFPDDKQHLGYMHVACRRTNPTYSWTFNYDLRISGWYDGDWGKSIMRETDKCETARGADYWRFEPEDQNNKDVYRFSDNSTAEYSASWTHSILMTDEFCSEKAIERALGLGGGSVTCTKDGWREVDMFAT